MKLFKSLLLGSAAGLVAASGASAADLGVKKPTPVEYVRVCSVHGAGFWYIPGSDVCIQLSGRVRAEYLYKEGSVRGEDASGFRANGRLNVDIRQATEYGLLRTFFRFDAYGNEGNYLPASQSAQSNHAGANTLVSRNGISTAAFGNVYLDKAFIQFYTGSAGFLTAGRTVSFFDFYANALSYSDVLIGSDNGLSNLFAYTFTFGGGWSATLSVEDPSQRRTAAGAPNNGVFAATGVVNLATGAVTPIVPVFPVGASPAAADISGAAGSTLVYSSSRMPEIVANVRVDQSWGSAQLSGVIRQIHSANWWQPVTGIAIAANGNVAVATNVLAAPRYSDTEYGWAIQGGVKINLPMIAAGDVLYLQAAYGQGAQSYVMGGGWVNGGGLGNQNVTGGIVTNTDGFVDPFGNIKLATSWSVLAGFQHYFTPSVRMAISAGYGKTEYSGLGANRVQTAATPAGSNLFLGSRSGFNDWQWYGVHGVLEWIPVRNLTIGASLHWQRVDPQGSVLTTLLNANGAFANGVGLANGFGMGGPAGPGAPVVRLTGQEDTFLARIRVERSF